MHAATCNPVCQNGGNCTSPGTCECTEGWTGKLCDEGTNPLCLSVVPLIKEIFSHGSGTATCRPPCEHGGTCLTPNQCGCTQGYSGDHCERGKNSYIADTKCCSYISTYIIQLPCILLCSPILTLCIAVCSPACQNGGNCTSPGTCECIEGWTGKLCDERKLFSLVWYESIQVG